MCWEFIRGKGRCVAWRLLLNRETGQKVSKKEISFQAVFSCDGGMRKRQEDRNVRANLWQERTCRQRKQEEAGKG